MRYNQIAVGPGLQHAATTNTRLIALVRLMSGAHGSTPRAFQNEFR